MTDTKAKQKIIIVGGGIGGLAAALALTRQGLSFGLAFLHSISVKAKMPPLSANHAPNDAPRKYWLSMDGVGALWTVVQS